MTEVVARKTSRWHWLWFGPACAFALLMSEGHTLRYALRIVQLAWHRWLWVGLLSPSAAFCWSIVIFSVTAPVAILIFAVGSFSQSPLRQAMLLIVVVLLLPFLTDALIWGSFPFAIDNAGVHRLRMIPFIPWPDAPFNTY